MDTASATTFSALTVRKLSEIHPLPKAHMLNYCKEGKVENSSLPFFAPNIPVLSHLTGVSYCFVFHKCAEILPPAAPLEMQFKIPFMLTAEKDDQLSKTPRRKSEKSVYDANCDMYSPASQAWFIPDGYGLPKQSLKALKIPCEEQSQALYLTSPGS